jgi:hypothetical protein
MAEHPYAFIFGKPGEGAHSTRFLGYALVDLIGTVLLAILVTYIWNVPLWKSIVGMFILGEVLHYLFGAQTAFLTTLGVRIKN